LSDSDRPCGCKEGALAALGALLIYLCLVATPARPEWLHGLSVWALGAGFVVAVSAGTKIAVILRGRSRYIREVLPPAAGR
jgi:hypothetical protein